MQNEQWGTQYPWPLASYFGDSMDAIGVGISKRLPNVDEILDSICQVEIEFHEDLIAMLKTAQDPYYAVKRVPKWNGIDVVVAPPARPPVQITTQDGQFLADFDQFIKDGRPKVEGRWGRWAAVLS